MFSFIMRHIPILLLGLFGILSAGASSGIEEVFPGIIISKSPEPDIQYVGSPSIAILPNGDYVASHDFFGKGGTMHGSTLVHLSKDKGKTWNRIAVIPHLCWASLFVQGNEVYLMGTKKGDGDFVILRSSDSGKSWTNPVSSDQGLLFRGKFHTAPVPVVEYKGRIWRAAEETVNKKGWPRKFGAWVMSAPIGSDLLKAENWTRSNAFPFSPDWITGARPGWLEGNIVVTPDGKLVNIMRTYALHGKKGDFEFKKIAAGIPRYELAAMLDVSEDGKKISFDPESGFFRFPGSQSKFTIRFDPVSNRYWALVNKITVQHDGRDSKSSPLRQRNVIMLTSSKDLRNWIEHVKVLRWGDGFVLRSSGRYGFQYLDWRFDGDDIIAVSRTAWGAKSYHDANLMTFHRIKQFRKLTMRDSVPDLASEAQLKSEGLKN